MALRSILSQLGPAAEGIFLIGGLTPRYLVPEIPPGIHPHMGTTDLDLVLTLAAAPDGDGERSLSEHLRSLGFAPRPAADEPREPVFRWGRRVGEVMVKVEFMCPAGDRPGGTIESNPAPGAGKELGALRIPGAELAALDYVERELAGPTIEGDHVVVRLRVANLLPFLVLKAFALDEREKDKDGYDIVWLLSAYGDTPADAARAARHSPVMDHPMVTRAIRRLREHFSTRDARGAELYAEAFPGADLVRRATLRRHAYATVQSFLRAWDAQSRVAAP
jgi:hypothetical protein